MRHVFLTRGLRSFCSTSIVVLLVALWSSSVAAQRTGNGSVSGVVTTQIGSLVLPGVAVSLVEPASGREIGSAVTGAEGEYEITGVPPGVYEVRMTLHGFADAARPDIHVAAGGRTQVDVDLEVAQVNEKVEVIGESRREEGERADRVTGGIGDIMPLPNDDFHSLLPTVPGVVRTPDGRIVLKGGRPSQTGMQVETGVVNDPSTGEFGFDLPIDAVESMDVIANPYAAELGGFSSGLTRIDTRQGSNVWRFSVKNFLPKFRFRGGKLQGISRFGPRMQIGGPIVRDRVFFMQSLQYEKDKTRINAAPYPFDDIELRRFGTFTRVDFASRVDHTIIATGSTFWRNRDFITLGVLTPQAATPNTDEDGIFGAVADAWTFSPTMQIESSLFYKGYWAKVFGQGDAPMELWPDGTRGHYFNDHDRRARTLQWNETFTMMRGSAGQHLVKVGMDLLRITYDGASTSRPVLLRRMDGTLAERIDFGPVSEQSTASTIVTMFAQDHWRIGSRVALDGGLRLEWDGVLDRANLSPRAGVTAAVLKDAQGVIRAGAGFFHERTPLNVSTFGSYENRTVTRFGPNGITPIAPPLTYAHVVEQDKPETPYGRTWNVEYDHRFNSSWVLKFSHLQRRGRDHLVVHPIVSGPSAQLRLASDGLSEYDETEVTARYRPHPDLDLTMSYVKSRSVADLNTYDTFFGHLRNPVIRPNEVGPTPVNVPHRFLIHGTLATKWKLTLAPIVEVRSGFPYSVVNELQDYVEPRNSRRFPSLFTADLAVTRPIRVKKRSIVVGIRAYHLLRNFEPREVYNNTAAPQFGTFVNPIEPKISFIVQLGK